MASPTRTSVHRKKSSASFLRRWIPQKCREVKSIYVSINLAARWCTLPPMHRNIVVFQTAEGKYLQTAEGKYLKLCSKWCLSGWPRNVLRLAAASSGDFFKWFIFGKQWPSQLLWHSWRWSAFQHWQKFLIFFAVVSSTLNDIEPYPCNFVSSKLNRKDEPSLSAHYKWPFSIVISKLAEVVSCMLGFRRFAEAWKFWCFRPPPEAPEAPEALAVQLLQIQSSSSTLLRKCNLTYRKRRTGQFFWDKAKSLE